MEEEEVGSGRDKVRKIVDETGSNAQLFSDINICEFERFGAEQKTENKNHKKM